MSRALARRLLVLLPLLPAFAPATAQVLVPPVAEPGDVLAIEGTGLSATAHVDFLAIVGGFIGFTHVVVPPLSVSDTRVEVEVPFIGHFLPPPPLADGDPLGNVGLLDAGFQLVGSQQPLWYLEITFGAVQTVGQGSPQPAPDTGEIVVGFALAGGAPAAGNADFELELHNATPGAPAFVLAGRPDQPPYPVLNGGELVVDLTAPFVLLGPYPVDAAGVARAPLPVPAAAAGATVALQWAFRHPQDNSLRLSNTLLAQL
jgi:hypothetical protein